jgi:hypothetical protein
MPSIQKRVVSVAEQIASLQARATKLETFPPNGATVLVQVNGSGASAMGFSTAWAGVTAQAIPLPATLRPIPVLAVVTLGQFFGTNTGTAPYVMARAGITGANQIPATDVITNAPLISGMSSCANASGVTQSACFIVSGILPVAAVGVPWYINLQYSIDGGATTGFEQPGPINGTANVTFLVLQLSG